MAAATATATGGAVGAVGGPPAPSSSTSTLGLVPITRSYLAKFYEKYPYSPASPDISSISARLREHWKLLEPQLSGLPPSLSLSLMSNRNEMV